MYHLHEGAGEQGLLYGDYILGGGTSGLIPAHHRSILG